MTNEVKTDSQIQIVIGDFDQTRTSKILVSRDTTGSHLISEVVKEWALPADTPFDLINATNGKEKVIAANASLGEAGVAEGDTLVVAPHLRAGGSNERK